MKSSISPSFAVLLCNSVGGRSELSLVGLVAQLNQAEEGRKFGCHSRNPSNSPMEVEKIANCRWL